MKTSESFPGERGARKKKKKKRWGWGHWASRWASRARDAERRNSHYHMKHFTRPSLDFYHCQTDMWRRPTKEAVSVHLWLQQDSSSPSSPLETGNPLPLSAHTLGHTFDRWPLLRNGVPSLWRRHMLVPRPRVAVRNGRLVEGIEAYWGTRRRQALHGTEPTLYPSYITFQSTTARLSPQRVKRLHLQQRNGLGSTGGAMRKPFSTCLHFSLLPRPPPQTGHTVPLEHVTRTNFLYRDNIYIDIKYSL